MIRVEIHETIAAPVHQVFDRIVDIDAYREWRTGGGGIFVKCRQDRPVRCTRVPATPTGRVSAP